MSRQPRPPTAPARVARPQSGGYSPSKRPSSSGRRASSATGDAASRRSSVQTSSRGEALPEVLSFAALLDYANGDRGLAEHAAGLCGLDLDDFVGREVLRLADEEEGEENHPKVTTPRSDDEAQQDDDKQTTPRRRSSVKSTVTAGSPKKPKPGLPVPRDAINLKPYRKSAADATDVLMMRWEHDQERLYKGFQSLCHAVAEVRESEADAALRSSKRRGHRNTAVESSRIVRERDAFATRVQHSVASMRRTVDLRRQFLARQLDGEARVQAEKDRDHDDKLAAARLHRRIQAKKTEAAWAKAEQDRRDAEQRAKGDAAWRAQATAEVMGDVTKHNLRRSTHLQGVQSNTGGKNRGRRDMHDYITKTKSNQDTERANQEAIEAEERQTALNVRNALLQEVTMQRLDDQRKKRESRYESATDTEAKRQHHFQDVRDKSANREASWRRAFLTRAKERDDHAKAEEARRQATLQKARSDEAQWQADTMEEYELKERLSDQHAARTAHIKALRDTKRKLVNEDRVRKANACTNARLFKEEQERQLWQSRKAQLQKEDAEIKRLQWKLRQDRERMALRMRQLEEARVKGDIQSLEQFVEHLDEGLRHADDSQK